MKTIETSALVSENGKLELYLPDISPGRYNIVMVIDKTPLMESVHKPGLKYKDLNWDNWPLNSTFRREDLYNDEGR